MEVTEQSETRLVVVASTPFYTYFTNLALLFLGILLLSGGNIVQGNNFFYSRIIAPVAIMSAIYGLASSNKRKLTIDKLSGDIVVDSLYLFGLLPIKRRGNLSDLKQFRVRHARGWKLGYALIRFKFCFVGKKIRFSSGLLHFKEGRSFLDPNAGDPRNTLDESLVLAVSSFLNMPIAADDRMLDSTDLKRRVMAVLFIFGSAFIATLAGIWAYYHLIHR